MMPQPRFLRLSPGVDPLSAVEAFSCHSQEYYSADQLSRERLILPGARSARVNQEDAEKHGMNHVMRARNCHEKTEYKL